MRLSIWMLVDRLGRFALEPHVESGKRVLRNARLLPEAKDLVQTTLYLQQTDSDTVMCTSDHDILVVHEGDVDAVLNAILDAFDQLNEWEAQLYDAMRTGCTLDELLASSAAMLDMNLVVADTTYYIYAHAQHQEPMLGYMKEILDAKSMNLEAILRIDADAKVRSATPGTYVVELPEYGSKSLVINLFVGGVHQGWLVGFRNQNDFTRGDADAIEALGKIVEAWMQLNQGGEAHREQTGVFARLLEGESVGRAELQRALATFAWREGDELRVFVARPASESSRPYQVTERFLRQLSPDSFVFAHEDDLVVVMNASLSEDEDYVMHMRYVLGQCGYAAGAGPAFTDLAELARCFEAAEVAADAAPAGEVVDFESVKLAYATSLVRSNAVSDVRHGALAALEAYDAEHHTQLLQTLEAFVRNRGSYVATYEELFIHRSTLAYRLERIESLTGIDFSDDATWTHLVLSFLL